MSVVVPPIEQAYGTHKIIPFSTKLNSFFSSFSEMIFAGPVDFSESADCDSASKSVVSSVVLSETSSGTTTALSTNALWRDQIISYATIRQA